MSIIFKGAVNGEQKEVVRQPVAGRTLADIIEDAKPKPVAMPLPETVVHPVVEQVAEQVIVQQVEQQNIPSDHPVVVVDGKVRKIGKKSQYLLDMLTIDSE